MCNFRAKFVTSRGSQEASPPRISVLHGVLRVRTGCINFALVMAASSFSAVCYGSSSLLYTIVVQINRSKVMVIKLM